MNLLKTLSTLKVQPPKFSPSTNANIDQFLSSLKENNLAKQRSLLTKLYASKIEPSVKQDCLNLFLRNYLKYPQFINVYDTRSLIDTYHVTEHRNRDLWQNAANCLLHAYKNDKSPQFKKLTIAKSIAHTLREMNLEPLQNLSSELADTVKEISKMTKVDLPVERAPAGEFEALDIEKYKRHGMIDLSDLCSYISVPFPCKKPTHQPLYEYYDTLSEQERARFMHEYDQFSTYKQHNVEQNCTNLTAKIDKIRPVLKLQFNNRSAVKQWFEFADQLDILITSPDSKIHKYQNTLQLIESKTLVNLLISRLFMHTVSYQNVYLYSLLKDLAYSFTKIVRTEHGVDVPLNYNDKIKLLSSVMDMLLDHCKVTVPPSFKFGNPKDDEELASFGDKLFMHKTGYRNGKMYGKIILNPYIGYQLKYNRLIYEKNELFLPMVCPPRPWTSPTNGGYLNDLKPIIISKDNDTYTEIYRQVDKTGQLDPVYNVLNYMGTFAWCINHDLLQVFKKVYESEHRFLKIPPGLQHIGRSAASSKAEKLELLRDVSRRSKYSLVYDFANAFKDNILYYPHAMDFRGRVYPMVSVLNYQDEDLVRGLLQSWEAKPLGPRGLEWLKYQLAGSYGQDKLDWDARLQFVDSHTEEVLGSATDPFTFTWWQEGEDPWQVLRLCMELKKIKDFAATGKDVKEYRCRVLIQQDGSCNGLQHYAALSRDRGGGTAVNLVAAKERHDIYNEVLSIIEAKVKANPSEMNSVIAKLISRKLIKRPIMTQVYGVTHFGAVTQILESLRDLDLHQLTAEEKDYFKSNRNAVAMEMANLTLSSIHDVFEKLIQVQSWLNKIALRAMFRISPKDLESQLDVINYKKTKPVMWTSLSGIPVVQLYRKKDRSIVKTNLQYFSVRVPERSNQFDVRKQMMGVAPNFIHSLDAVHLQLTCEACQQNQVPFVAVHDSFWTDTSNADTLARFLRQAFVEMYAHSPLDHLYEDLKNTVKGCVNVVWFSNHDNPALAAAVARHRASVHGKFKSKDLSSILVKEGVDLEISRLLEKHKPELYLRRSSSLVPYDGLETTSSVPFSLGKFTPVMVHSTVIPPPPAGHLDLTEVLHSRFFFS